MASEPCLLGSAITAFRERRSGRSSMDRLPAHVRGDSSSGQAATAQCARVQPVIACAAEQEHAIGLLKGVVVAHHGSSYRRPGYSSLKVVSNPEAAYITAAEPRTGVHKRWLTAERENNIVRVGWTCKHLSRAASRQECQRDVSERSRTCPPGATRTTRASRETSVITGHIDTQEDGTARVARNQLF
jgi:hypothetical protein